VPDPRVLYVVTGVVVLALLVWVIAVLWLAEKRLPPPAEERKTPPTGADAGASP
jgi:hypothetical protein